MTNEEKQALIEGCTQRVDALNKYCRVNPGDHEAALDLSLCKIALAALNAQPVKLPKGFSPGIGDIFDKTAPVMRRDASDGKWLHKADVTKILNELGYEVQE